jgi:DnaJ-class molecular chaperone
MANQDFYSILGVSKTASDSELKSAYRKQALKWHPDKHKGEAKKEAEQKFKEVNQAYEVLKNPQKKQAYDQMGHSAFTQGGSGGSQGFGGAGGPFSGGQQQGPFRYTYSSSGGNVNFEDVFGGSDPFDIFEQFFGGGQGQRRQQKQVYHANIDFMEAIKGVEKSFIIQGVQKKVNIPAGINSNTRIRFNEFDLVVEVKPHEIFKRQGQDIIVDHKITFSQAALGDTVEVPTIDGNFKLKVRPGTQPGSLVRLREKGVPFPRSNRRGDQYVRFVIEIPKNLSRKQKELLQEFEKES